MNRFSIFLLSLLVCFIPLLYSVPSAYGQAFFNQEGVKFEYRGNWNSTADYNSNDAVRGSDGKLYVATEDNVPRNTNPVGATRYWAEATSSAIPQGPQGPRGLQGPAGPRGQQGNPGSDGTTGSTGPRGPQGIQGIQGPRGLQGLPGNPGAAGSDGINGYSTRLIYRKVNTFDYTTIPSVTYNGTRPPDGTSLSLPTQWSVTPYVSQTFNNWNDPDITAPEDLVVDPDSGLIYIVQTGSPNGTVYKFDFSGSAPGTNPSWILNSGNRAPRGIAISGNFIYVLNTARRSADNNYLNDIFVYAKSNGILQTTITITTPDMHPEPRAITIEGSSIYIASQKFGADQRTTKAIRVFNLQGVEQTTLGLNVFPASNDTPIAIESDDRFLYVLNGSDDKIYVYDRNDPDRRIESLEFSLARDTIGFALSEFEAFSILSSNSNVYRYYNPRNIVWGSALFVQEQSPFTVVSSPLLQMTARRSEGGTGGVTIIQGGGGTGGSGQAGDSVRFIYQEVGEGTTAPRQPPTTLGAYTGGRFTPPQDWHLTEAGALRAFGQIGDLYVSVVRLSGDGDTILEYGAPFKVTGPRGPPGNSTTFIYNAKTTVPAPATGGTWDGTTLTLSPSAQTEGWSVNPPGSLTPGQTLYLSEVTLPGVTTDALSYKPPFSVPRGEQGPQGAQGPRGTQGPASTEPGPEGTSFRLIFQEALAEPSLPSGGTWDGTTFRVPSGWVSNSPHRSVNDPENLYATGVELPGGGGTPHYQGVFQLNGPKGDQGDAGTPGTRGDGTELIFLVGTSPPAAPASGSGTWNPTTDTYTPPTSWSLDSSAYTGTNNLYAVKVTLPGSSTEETYSTVIRLNGPPGPRGQQGP